MSAYNLLLPLALHTFFCLLESGQKTLTEVAEFLKSVLITHTRTEMGEDNLSASQSQLQRGGKILMG